MKKKYCYYGTFLLPAFVFWLAGCTDEFLPSPAVQTELKEFALEEAQEYFRSEAEKEGVRSRGESEVKALSLLPATGWPVMTFPSRRITGTRLSMRRKGTARCLPNG